MDWGRYSILPAHGTRLCESGAIYTTTYYHHTVKSDKWVEPERPGDPVYLVWDRDYNQLVAIVPTKHVAKSMIRLLDETAEPF